MIGTATSTPSRPPAHAAASARHAAPRLHNPTWTLILVCTAVFMLLLDLTIVSVALGNIQTEFGASLQPAMGHRRLHAATGRVAAHRRHDR